MTSSQRVIEFIEESRSVGGKGQFMALLARASREMGFDWYASIQVRIGRTGRPYPLVLTNFPGDWHPTTGGSPADDHPAYLAGMRMSVGFRWSDVHRIVPLGERQHAMLRWAREMGVVEGYCVPGHVPGEASGLTTFAVGADRPFPEARLPMAQIVGLHAFEALRRIERSMRGQARIALTPRQIQCTMLAARGRSDREIADILGIKEDTVSEHLDASRRRYGVVKRCQLVVRALYDGHFGLTDAVDR